jgi:hypothetical protein
MSNEGGSEMTTVLVRCQVADYESWRHGYEQFFASPFGDHVRSSRIWRGQDDPNLVVLAETYESRELAGRCYEPAMEAMVRDGVDLSSVHLDYLDEVGALTR